MLFSPLFSSHFRLQGYTEKLVPSHRDIQKCLVDIGDKPSSFIGSKQWIGSTEVGFVLETLLGVTIKVLCASNGLEMPTLASSLAYHFKTQGTPVMIGNEISLTCSPFVERMKETRSCFILLLLFHQVAEFWLIPYWE